MILQNPHECIAMVSLANTKDMREPMKVDALQLDIENMTLFYSLWICLDQATTCKTLLVPSFLTYLDDPDATLPGACPATM